MKRFDFLSMLLLGGIAANKLSSMKSVLPFWEEWPDLGFEMPIMFVGHGAPNVAAEENFYTKSWYNMADGIPRPKAILCLSAHWLTNGVTKVSSILNPATMYDFGGMDPRLYQMKYPAPGSPELASFIQDEIQNTAINLDRHWGFDHGTWCVFYHMFPKADIPILQMSIDYSQDEQFHYNLGKELSKLRRKGILLVSSGNIVHNLSQVIFDENAKHDWALEYDELSRNWLIDRNDRIFLDRSKQGDIARKAIPTPDHYFPLLYSLGMKNEKDELLFFNESVNYGSVSMRSMVYGKLK